MDIEVDNVGQLWLSWWIEQYFSADYSSLFYTPFLNAPNGAEVLTYDVAFANLMFSGLLRPVLGMFASLNFVFVASLLFSLFGTYILLRQVNDSPLFSAALSIIPMLYITRQGAGFVDIDLVNYGWGLFAMAFWINLLKHGGTRRMILCGLFIGLTCVFHMYHGINLLIVLSLGLIATILRLEPVEEGQELARNETFGTIFVGIILALPFLLPSAGSLSEIANRERLPFFPSHEVGFLTNEREYLALIALIPLAVLIVFLGKRSREIRFWSLATSALCILAAGTHLRLFGSTYIPMPFLLLKNYVPFFWRYNFTDRFGRMAVVLFVLVLALSARRIAKRFNLPWWKMLPVGCALWLIGFFLAPTMIGLTPRGTADLKPIPMDTVIAGRIKKADALFENRKPEDKEILVDLFCEDVKSYGLLFQLAHQLPIAGDPLRPDGMYDPDRDSDLTLMKNNMCVAAEKGQMPELPEGDLLRTSNVRFLLLPQTYLAKVDSSFLSNWEARYGPAGASDEFVRLYDLNAP
jgi:hypothetical protein